MFPRMGVKGAALGVRSLQIRRPDLIVQYPRATIEQFFTLCAKRSPSDANRVPMRLMQQGFDRTPVRIVDSLISSAYPNALLK